MDTILKYRLQRKLLIINKITLSLTTMDAVFKHRLASFILRFLRFVRPNLRYRTRPTTSKQCTTYNYPVILYTYNGLESAQILLLARGVSPPPPQ